MTKEKLLLKALQDCVNAMKYSKEIGCTEYLDAAEDGGDFWYAAMHNAEDLLNSN